jgi:hypothetical protein
MWPHATLIVYKSFIVAPAEPLRCAMLGGRGWVRTNDFCRVEETTAIRRQRGTGADQGRCGRDPGQRWCISSLTTEQGRNRKPADLLVTPWLTITPYRRKRNEQVASG